jgi:hypothetical protein
MPCPTQHPFHFILLRTCIVSLTILFANSGCKGPSGSSPLEARNPTDTPVYVDGPGISEPVTDPAEICFADTDAFIRLTELAAHNNADPDALFTQVAGFIEDLCTNDFSTRAAQAFGVTPRNLFNRLFGNDVAMIDRQHGSNSPVLIISKAAPEDLQRLPDALGAKVWKTSPTTGGYPTYVFSTGEHQAQDILLTVGTQWFFLCEKRHVGHLRTLLRQEQGTRKTLAQHPEYRRLYTQTDAFGFVVVRGAAQDTVAATIKRSEAGYELDLASRLDLPPDAILPAPERDAPHPFLAERHNLHFGPLPENTAAALALNFLHRKPKDLGALDIPVIFGSVRSTILPGIEPPLIAALASVPSPVPEDETGIPALLLCARAPDAAVAKSLDSVIGTFHLLATLGAFEFKKSLFGVTEREYRGTPYTLADFGDGIIARLPENFLLPLADLPEPAGLRKLCFGRIDDWYVLSTQEACFHACVDATGNPSKSWTINPVFNAPELHHHRQNLATVVLETSRVGAMVSNASTRYEQARSAPVEEPPQQPPGNDVPNPLDSLGKVTHTLSGTARDLSDYWRRMHTVAKEEPAPKKKSSIGEKKREVQSNQPAQVAEARNALKSLQDIAAALEFHQAITIQLWRAADNSPGGKIRITER